MAWVMLEKHWLRLLASGETLLAIFARRPHVTCAVCCRTPDWTKNKWDGVYEKPFQSDVEERSSRPLLMSVEMTRCTWQR